MYFKNDWMMRQTDTLVRFLAKTVLKKDTPEYEPGGGENFSDGDLLHRQLLELLGKGRICTAEDLLYDRLDPADVRYLSLALDFYDRLNRLPDDELEDGGFSREEVGDGVRQIMRRFNIPDLPF